MSKRLGGTVGCKDKTSSWHLNGFPDCSNIGSITVVVVVVVVSHIQRIGCQPEKTTLHGGQSRSWSNVGEKLIVIILYTWTKNLNASRLDLLSIQRIGCPPEKLLYTVVNPARGLLNREIYTGVCMREKWRK